jgi:hypothetical protein
MITVRLELLMIRATAHSVQPIITRNQLTRTVFQTVLIHSTLKIRPELVILEILNARSVLGQMMTNVHNVCRGVTSSLIV